MANETTQRNYTENEVMDMLKAYGQLREIETARAALRSQGLDPEDTEMPITREVYNRWVSRIPENIRGKLELKLM